MTIASDVITIHTAQRKIIKEILDTEGVYRVQGKFIDKKYGDQAWIFKTAYSFFNQYAPQYLAKPEGAESGIWTYLDKRWVGAQPECMVMTFEVPRNEVLLFDLRLWNKILNLDYIAENEADAKRFQQNLDRMGIAQSLQAFTTPFYPTVKREITNSWQRLFDSAQDCPETYLEAAVWELKKDWLIDYYEIE